MSSQLSATSKVSFTIRRPTPVSRATSSGADSDSGSFKVPSLPRHLTTDSGTGSPLARDGGASPKRTYSEHRYEDDSSDEEDDRIQDELVTGFDEFGVQRLYERKKKQEGPLVIAPLQNKDWRELARKRKSAKQYVPASAAAQTGKDGSVGGLGTRDTINSGPVKAGLQVKRVKLETEVGSNGSAIKMEEVETVVHEQESVKMEVEETEDQRALRALLSQTDGQPIDENTVDIIETPLSETDAYKQDVSELPESASLDAYTRIPVSQFGAAMLRGMGWKEGTPASRTMANGKKAMVEPWLPTARPALLGLGAKEREVLDDGSASKGGKGKKRPEKRYVPVIKREKDGESRALSPSPRAGSKSGSATGSGKVSRRSSRSPSRRRETDRHRDRDRDRREDYREDDRDRRRERDYSTDGKRDSSRRRSDKSDERRDRERR